ncbi:MAG: hypothetical protein A2536_09420 [Candidatus Firestonebacteria bacterium RIFOXYD2_FULL_39_29]|nr:MAG: hypothetical protein A2536_09420 [Candidatus Firestonebacteria bacterium RIFOXYD2_FULL_39_29]
MKKNIKCLAFLLITAGLFSQTLNPKDVKNTPIKKFEVKSSSSTASTIVTSAPVTTSKADSSSFPPLPAGQKRIDINVIQEEYYECPKCKRQYGKAGKCLLHSIVLVKKTRSFTFKCKLCGYISEKEGKCPSCKDNPVLKKFQVTYQDIGCSEVSSEPGKCPKCKQDLKRIINVEIKK